MNTPKAIVSCVIILVVLVLVLPAQGQTGGIVVNGADQTLTSSLTSSSGLNTSITNVGPRFVVQYANANQYYTFVTVPNTLQTLLGQVGTRFIIQYANANRVYGFIYPLDLVGDSTPPQISGLVANPIGAGVEMISWTTNELATSSLHFGTQSGVYTQTISNTLFKRLHEVTIAGVKSSTKYYYYVSNTDRSGNSSQSQEYIFTPTTFVYLPLTRQ